MFVTGKNTITKIVQINNGFDGLMGELALLEFVLSTVTLSITEFPNGMNRIDKGSKRTKNTKFVNHFWVEVVNEEFVLKSAPMNGTKAFQKIWPAKIGLALTQDLVVMGKLVEGKRSGMKNTEKSFSQTMSGSI